MKIQIDKILEWLPAVFFVIGGVLFSIFSRLAFPNIANIGLLIIGAGIVLIGIRPIIEMIHSMAFTTDHPPSKGSRTLLPPVLHGSMIVLIGCALMLYALVVISGWAGQVAAYFSHRPGLLLIFFGVLGEVYALYLIIRRQDVSGFFERLKHVIGLCSAGLLLIASAVIFIVGLIEIFSPSSFHQLKVWMVSTLNAFFLYSR